MVAYSWISTGIQGMPHTCTTSYSLVVAFQTTYVIDHLLLHLSIPLGQYFMPNLILLTPSFIFSSPKIIWPKGRQMFCQNLSHDQFKAFCSNFIVDFWSSWPPFLLFLDLFDHSFSKTLDPIGSIFSLQSTENVVTRPSLYHGGGGGGWLGWNPFVTNEEERQSSYATKSFGIVGKIVPRCFECQQAWGLHHPFWSTGDCKTFQPMRSCFPYFIFTIILSIICIWTYCVFIIRNSISTSKRRGNSTMKIDTCLWLPRILLQLMLTLVIED